MEVSRITFTHRLIYIKSRHRRSLCFTIYPRATTQHRFLKEVLMMARCSSAFTFSSWPTVKEQNNGKTKVTTRSHQPVPCYFATFVNPSIPCRHKHVVSIDICLDGLRLVSLVLSGHFDHLEHFIGYTEREKEALEALQPLDAPSTIHFLVDRQRRTVCGRFLYTYKPT
jgi:hypothetical protein